MAEHRAAHSQGASIASSMIQPSIESVAAYQPSVAFVPIGVRPAELRASLTFSQMALRASNLQQSGFGTVAPSPHRPPATTLSLGHLALAPGHDGSRRTAAGAVAAPASNQRREVVAPARRLRRTLTQQGRSSFGTTSDPQAAAADYEDDYAHNPSTTDYGFLPTAKAPAVATDSSTGGVQPDLRFSRHTLGRQQGLSAVTEASPMVTMSRTSPWESMPRASGIGRRSSASAGTRSLATTLESRSGGQGLEAQLVGGDGGSERRTSLSRTQLRSLNGSVVWEQSVPVSLYPSNATGGGGNANSLVRSQLEPIRPSPFGSAEDVAVGAAPTAASPTSPVSASAASATGEKDNLVSHESVSGEARRRWSDKALEAVLSVLEWLRSALLNPLDPEVFWIRSWLLLMDVLHIISWIVGPVFLAWSEYISPAVLVASLVRDLLLMISCYLQSRFLFKNEYGLPVHDTGEIRRHFLFTKRGFLQVFGTIPTQFIGRIVPFPSGLCSAIIPEANVDTVLYAQNRLCALIFLGKIFIGTPYARWYNANIPSLPLPISRFLKTLLILMVMGHIDACLFWFLESLLDSDNSWVYTEALVVDDQSEPVQFQTQYLVSYLTALRSLVLKLRDVTLAAEDVFVIFEFVAGILAYGTVFGNIHSIVEMLDKTAVLNQAEELHQYQMDWLRAYMREKKLRPDLQQMVTAYKEIQWQRSKGMDEELLFSDIPRSVQQEIKNFLYLELVKKVPAFVNTDANFQNLIAFKIKAMVVLDGWYIFRKGDDAEEMFFIKSGKVDICGDQGQIFVTLVTGQFFGEIALFEASKRTATARAKGNVELCSLSKESFNHIMNTYPDVARRIQETIEERKRVEKKKEEERRLREAEAELQKELLATSEKDPAGSSSQPLPPPASK